MVVVWGFRFSGGINVNKGAQMKVYILEQREEYAGGEIVGVYSTLERAKAMAPTAQWEEVHKSEDWIALNGSNPCYLYIHSEVVQDLA